MIVDGQVCRHGHQLAICGVDKTGNCRKCHSAASLAYYVANREKVQKYQAEWRKANPRNIRVRHAAYHAKKRSNAQGSYTEEQILELIKKQKGRCANPDCGKLIADDYHADHVVPLKNGGDNFITNIQLLCPPCNRRKRAKDPFEWANQNGRLL